MSYDAPNGGHGYPCSGPWHVFCEQLADSFARQATLQRCVQCGALWERDDRSAHRMTAAVAEAKYPGVSISPFEISTTESTSPPSQYWAHLNEGKVFRLYLATTRGGVPEIWAIIHGAVLQPLPSLDLEGLEVIDRTRFDDLILAQWPEAAEGIQIALAAGLHPLVLKALDLVSRWGIAPTLTVGGTPESTADSLLRPLLDAEVVTVDDLRIEGYGWFGQA